jgi:hypothetical protein
MILFFNVLLDEVFFILDYKNEHQIVFKARHEEVKNYKAQISFFSCTFPLSTTYTLSEESIAMS